MTELEYGWLAEVWECRAHVGIWGWEGHVGGYVGVWRFEEVM